MVLAKASSQGEMSRAIGEVPQGIQMDRAGVFTEASSRRIRQLLEAIEIKVPQVFAQVLSCRVRQTPQTVEQESAFILTKGLGQRLVSGTLGLAPQAGNMQITNVLAKPPSRFVRQAPDTIEPKFALVLAQAPGGCCGQAFQAVEVKIPLEPTETNSRAIG